MLYGHRQDWSFVLKLVVVTASIKDLVENNHHPLCDLSDNRLEEENLLKFQYQRA